MKYLKEALIGIISFPLAIIFFLLYAHISSLLDPVLSVVIGGAFWLFVLITVVVFALNMKDFIVSIFKKKQRERRERV